MTRTSSLPYRFLSYLIVFSVFVGACGGQLVPNNEDGATGQAVQDGDRLESTEGEPPSNSGIPPQVGNDVTFPVDPIFTDFYTMFGGERVLGPAIARPNQVGRQVHQYVQAGLMVFDPKAPETEHFRWAPLGEGFGIREEPVTNPGGNARFINGHSVYPAFEDLFDDLGGVRLVGEPLIEARYNLEKKRIEQYFGNLGFYILDDDSSQQIHLLAYGAFDCHENCRRFTPENLLPDRNPPLPEPFRSVAARLGLPFVGKTLTEPRFGSDGSREIVFANLALVQNASSSETIAAQPIVSLLNADVQPPVEEEPGDLMEFIRTDGQLGHNVPIVFLEYLERHGGLDFFGPPVSEVFNIANGIFRQCFAAVCIELDMHAPEGNRIRLAPIGVEYLSKFGDSRADDFSDEFSLDGVEINVWEKEPFVSTNDPQEIFAAIFIDGRALANREPVIQLTMPDGRTVNQTFPPTNKDGQTSIRIMPISAPLGTLIAYEICLKTSVDEECKRDNYLIWDYPK